MAKVLILTLLFILNLIFSVIYYIKFEKLYSLNIFYALILMIIVILKFKKHNKSN